MAIPNLKLGLSANASQLNNITIDDGARSEIQQALVQGLEVTVHQFPITVNGWQGSGYSVIDPEMGVGAYQISGGASGGFLMFAAIVIMFGILMFGAGVAILAASGFWSFLFSAAALYLEIDAFKTWVKGVGDSKNFASFNQHSFTAVINALIGAVPLWQAFGKGTDNIVRFVLTMFSMGVSEVAGG